MRSSVDSSRATLSNTDDVAVMSSMKRVIVFISVNASSKEFRDICKQTALGQEIRW